LGQLDCGVNYASDVARALGVSRQMVAKTVADLVRKGWLKQVPDPERGNRKVIRFTAKGERVMSDARAILEEMDGLLDAELGRGWDERLTRDLEGLASSVGRS
jgi:DNA-binding MarR family transcriptional regulator